MAKSADYFKGYLDGLKFARKALGNTGEKRTYKPRESKKKETPTK